MGVGCKVGYTRIMVVRKRKSRFGPAPGSIGKYPWTKWFDGRQRTIRRGKDFKCSVRSMTVYLYQRAALYGLQVSVNSIGASKLSIQAHNGK